MITGALMYDIQVEASNQEDLESISREIQSALKQVKGVSRSEEVDTDLSNSDEESDE